MLLLFSKGRSLPARTQPPSPSICLLSVLPSPCLLDQILTEPFILFDTSSGFAATCRKLDKDAFCYLEYISQASMILHFEMKLLFTFPNNWVLSFPPLLFPVCLYFSTCSCIFPFSCLFHVSPSPPLFPIFWQVTSCSVAYFSSTWLCRQENQMLWELCRGKTKRWLGIHIRFLLQGHKAGDVSGFLLKMTCCQNLSLCLQTFGLLVSHVGNASAQFKLW